MKIVLQRVKRASVTIDGEIVGSIQKGMLCLIGVHKDDTMNQADFLARKCAALRVFSDKEGKMNLSLSDIRGEALVVSQFTLYADTRKGRRPAYVEAAEPTKGNELYEYFVEKLRELIPVVQTGRFGAMMDVELVNDGPVTIILER